MYYGICPRCGTTVKLTSGSTGPTGNYRIGKCPNCGNKVVEKK